MGYLFSSIRNEEENTVVADYLKSKDIWSVWLGGYQTGFDDEPAGNWVWLDGIVWGISTYTNWNTGEPSDQNNEEHYLELYNSRKWNDKEQNRFLPCLFRDPNIPTITSIPNSPFYVCEYPLKTWDECRSTAENRGYTFASIQNQQENDAVADYLQSNDIVKVWLGGYQTSYEDEPAGNWAWLDGTQWGDSTYTNWAWDQPNNLNNNEHHLYLWVSVEEWFDGNKDNKWPCIFRDPNIPTITSIPNSPFYVCEYPLKTWDECRSTAENRGYTFASIQNQQENDAVADYLDSSNDYNRVWLGGYQTSYEDEPAGNWAWLDGTPWTDSTYTNWHLNEPNNHGNLEEHYLHLLGGWNGEWNDSNKGIKSPCLFKVSMPEFKLIGSTHSDVISKWRGGVLGPDGSIYAIPTRSTRILEINPFEGTTGLVGSELEAGVKWNRGTILNGIMYGFPEQGANILSYNINSDVTKILAENNAILTNGEIFSGGVTSNNGNMYTISLQNHRKVIKFDPLNTNQPLTEIGPVSSNREIILGQDGYIYVLPQTNNRMIKINPDNDSFSFIGDSFPGGSYHPASVFANDGNIYLCPYNANRIMQFHVESGTYNLVGPDLGSVARKWYGFVAGRDGHLYGMPAFSNDVLLFDPFSRTCDLFPLDSTMTGDDKWWGGILANNGSIYAIPFRATRVLEISFP